MNRQPLAAGGRTPPGVRAASHPWWTTALRVAVRPGGAATESTKTSRARRPRATPRRALPSRVTLVLVARVFGATVPLWLGGAPLSAQQAPSDYIAAIEGVQSPNRQGLDALTLAEVMERFGVPGMSVAVIHDFEVHWAKGYGVADVVTGAPVDTETLFQAASISKPVTAMAAMTAVQDGLFALDDDINSILRSWRLPGRGLTQDRPVTPRLLFSHTAGLGDGHGFPGYAPDAPRPTPAQILEGHAPSNVGPVELVRPPLTAMHYSGGGTTIMQLALTDVRGESFPDLMRRTVLEPVGMTHSTFEHPLPPARDRNAARGHRGDGLPMGTDKWHAYAALAAAGLWTTPTDLARFAIEVQRASGGDPNRVLSRASAREMLSPVGVGSYGVGFHIERRGQGWYFSHSGGNWGFVCQLTAHKAKGYGVVVMTNSSGGGALQREVVERIERAYGWDSLAVRG